MTDKAVQNLNDFVQNAKNKATELGLDLQNASDYCLVIIGQTDHQKYNSNSAANNQKLSERRANSVKTAIESAFNEKNIKTYGVSNKLCPKQPVDNPKCRMVNVRLLSGPCDSALNTTTNWIRTIAKAPEAIETLKTAISTLGTGIQQNQ